MPMPAAPLGRPVYAILAALFVAASTTVHAAARPNIVFIMSDDHAAHAISAYGSAINRTHHLEIGRAHV